MAKCAEGEVLESSANKIAPAKISDHVGYCSHHASRDLLQQEICRAAKGPEDCFQPAVAELLAIDAKELKSKSPSYYADSEDALRELLKQKTIASEDCLSLSGLFPPTAKKDFSDYGVKFTAATLVAITEECKKQGEKESKCQREVRTPEGHKKFLYAAVDRYKSEKKCPEKSIPPIFIRETETNAKGLSPTENLNKILRSGYQTKIVTTDPHALVVSNYRVICRKGKKILQYQTLDSLYGTKWSVAKKPGDWVDGDSLIKSLDPKIPFLTVEASTSNGNDPSAAQVVW